MFVRTINLFRLAGIPVRIDLSWFLVAVLVTWTLATGWFPVHLEGLTSGDYWIAGAGGAAGLFVSIVLHELGHSLVSRRCGMSIRGITLFIFGGVAEMDDEPPDAKSEFLVAIASPVISAVTAFAFYGMCLDSEFLRLPPAALAMLSYLGFVNGLMFIFNTVPAFPLDGGRILRALLWVWNDDLRKATRISAVIGSVIAILFVLVGVLALVKGSVLIGVWWCMIGVFVRHAAHMSYHSCSSGALSRERRCPGS
ncbi:MAG: site-2 protease family protein [Verrucomicrobiae bacterium]|nr:site-2 protease family protein [Verrucomicrobiae bacterium]